MQALTQANAIHMQMTVPISEAMQTGSYPTSLYVYLQGNKYEPHRAYHE